MTTASLCPVVKSPTQTEPVLTERASTPDRFTHFATQIGTLLGCDAIVLLTTFPPGMIRLCRTFNFSRDLFKSYPGRLGLQNELVWNALLQGFVHTQQAELLAEFPLTAGYVSATAIRIENPVFSGYPGLILALRGSESHYPLQSEPESQAAVVCEIFDRILARPAPLPGQNKYFILDCNGTCLFGKSGLEQLDPVIRDQILEHVSKTPVDPQPFPGTRHLLRDSQGHLHAFHFLSEMKGPTVSSQPVWFVTLAPSLSDWESVQPHTFQADPDLQRFSHAIRFILQNLHTCPDIAQIARTVQLSPFHFHRKFTALFGITPKQLLADLQIQTAQTLLMNGKLSLQHIAHRCGFSHQSHFTSRFKQTVGMTPSRWRRGKMLLTPTEQMV